MTKQQIQELEARQNDLFPEGKMTTDVAIATQLNKLAYTAMMILYQLADIEDAIRSRPNPFSYQTGQSGPW
jgi:hypothetical protein